MWDEQTLEDKKPAAPQEVVEDEAGAGGVDGMDTFKLMVKNRPLGVEDMVSTATAVQLERDSPDEPFEVITPAPKFAEPTVTASDKEGVQADETAAEKPAAEADLKDLKAADDFLHSVELRKGPAEDWLKMAEDARKEKQRQESIFEHRSASYKANGTNQLEHEKQMALYDAGIAKSEAKAAEIKEARQPFEAARQGGNNPEGVAARAKLLGEVAAEEFAKLPPAVQEAIRVRDRYEPGTPEWDGANRALAGMVKEGEIETAFGDLGKGRGIRPYQTADHLKRYDTASGLGRKLGGGVEEKTATGEPIVQEGQPEEKQEKEARFKAVCDKLVRGEMTSDEFMKAYAAHKGLTEQQARAELIPQLRRLAAQANELDGETELAVLDGEEISPEALRMLIEAHPEFAEVVAQPEVEETEAVADTGEEVGEPAGPMAEGEQPPEKVDKAAVKRKGKFVYLEVRRLAKGKMDVKREEGVFEAIAAMRQGKGKKELTVAELAAGKTQATQGLAAKGRDLEAYKLGLERKGFWGKTMGKLSVRRIEDYEPMIDIVASGPKEHLLIRKEVERMIHNERIKKAVWMNQLETMGDALKGMKEAFLKMIYEALQQEIQQQGG